MTYRCKTFGGISASLCTQHQTLFNTGEWQKDFNTDLLVCHVHEVSFPGEKKVVIITFDNFPLSILDDNMCLI